MLVALNEQGEVIVLENSITKTTLQQMRTKTFYCPQCKQPLLLKAGAVKMPHFAHRANSECINYFAEGESYPHLLGKSQLFDHFAKYYSVQLEPYLPTLKQRPDLLIHIKNTYALEFQCSRLDPVIFQQRTAGYEKSHIKPIWLVKTPNVSRTEGQVCKGSFNLFLQQFMQEDYLVTYHPEEAVFVYFSSLLYLQGRSFLYIPRSLPLVSQRLPFYEPKKSTEQQFSRLLTAYESHRRQFLHTRLFYSRKGVNDLFLRAIYDMRLNKEQMPTFIGIPVRFAQGIPQFSAEWQLLLFYFMQQHQLSFLRMNDAMKHYFLKWARLPETQEAFLAVQAYIHILQALHIEHVYMPCDQQAMINKVYGDFIAIPTNN